MKTKIKIVLILLFLFGLLMFGSITVHGKWKIENDNKNPFNISKFKEMSPTIQYLVNFYEKFLDDIPTIYVITPTYYRETQLADMTSLRNTLLLVPNVVWIVIEDSKNITERITEFLHTFKIAYVQLNSYTPMYNSSGVKDKRIRGVVQRNCALRWLKDNRKDLRPGVIYFADDDNRYDLRVFEEMRWTKKVSVWPVGLVAQMYYERPICKNGKVIGFFAWIKRPFAVDMAGFAVNLDYFLSFPDAKFLPTKGKLETNFLQQLVTIDELEPKADNCSKVYVWHTKTMPPEKFLDQKLLLYRHNMTYEPELVLRV